MKDNMSAIQFIGFIIMMIASVILSFKRKREKKESLNIFEQFEKKHKKAPKLLEDFYDEEEEEEEKKKEVAVVKKAPPPKIPSASPLPVQQDFLKKDTHFDIHDEAFTKKGWAPSESSNFIVKLKSMQEAIVIQEIMNKPKGW